MADSDYNVVKIKEALNEGKICSRCREIKKFIEFHRDNHSSDGYQYTCKACKFRGKDKKKKVEHRFYNNNFQKRCNKCREYKGYDSFWEDLRSRDELHHTCKECCAARRNKQPIPIELKENLSVEEKINFSWCAGFLEGEGCFTLLINKHAHELYRSVSLSALQVKIGPLEKLIKILGGKIDIATDARGKQIHNWRIQDRRKIKETVPYLLPYLIEKKREAEIILEFASLTDGGRGKSYSEDGNIIRRSLIKELSEIRAMSKSNVC